MENSPTQLQKQKNSNLSIFLIAINILLSLIFFLVLTEDNDLDYGMMLFAFAISVTILLGPYAFTYHGKGYRWAKWVFGLAFIISLVFIGLLWYATGLAAAFKN